jgi:hypothetical protein
MADVEQQEVQPVAHAVSSGGRSWPLWPQN